MQLREQQFLVLNAVSTIKSIFDSSSEWDSIAEVVLVNICSLVLFIISNVSIEKWNGWNRGSM